MTTLLWMTLVLAAQEPSAPRFVVPEKTPDILSPGIRPDAVFMRNNMGEYILVPRSKYEEFEKFLHRDEDETLASIDTPSLNELEVVSSIENNVARLHVVAKIRFVEPNKNWMSVPIGFGLVQVVPTENPKEVSNRFPPLRISSESGGYLWRLSPSSEAERTLEFDAVCNLASTAQGQSLRLDLPAVPSRVRLHLPKGPWDVNVTGTGSEVVEPFRESETHSEGLIRTSGGPIVLTWTKQLAADQIQAIEVESKTSYASTSDVGILRAVSNLAIRGPKSLGGRLFLVTLPAGCQWREPAAALIPFQGYRVTRSETAKPEQTVLRVEFEESVSRTDGEVNIEWQSKFQTGDQQVEFAIPIVEGVQRHVGSLDLTLPRGIQLRWEPQTGIEFAKQFGDTSEMMGYSFRVVQQTQPLIVTCISGDNAAKLRGSYQILCDESSLFLSGSIEIVEDLRSLPFLQLELSDWSIEQIQVFPSGRLMDISSERTQDPVTPIDGQLQKLKSIPISVSDLETMPATNGNGGVLQNETGIAAASEVPTSSDSTRASTVKRIAFLLSQPMDRQNTSSTHQVHFALPMLSWIDRESQKRITASAPGEMSISSYDSLIAPSEGVSSGPWVPMIDRTVVPTPASKERENAPWRSSLRYRVQSSSQWAFWSGTASVTNASMRANAETTIQLAGGWVDFAQTWTLQAQGRFPTSILVAIPKDWIAESKPTSDAVRITMDGHPITMSDELPIVSASIGTVPLSPELASRYIWWKLPLDKELRKSLLPLGSRSITIRKRWSYPDESNEIIAFDWALPFLASSTADDALEIDRYVGEIRVDATLQCAIVRPIRMEMKSSPASSSTVTFDCSLQEPQIVGRLRPILSPSESGVTIESAWLQTMQNAVEQRERYVVRFSTHADSVYLVLPADRIADCRLLINGKKAFGTPNVSRIGRLDIPLLDFRTEEVGKSEMQYVLEVFTWPSPEKRWMKQLKAEVPQILESSPHFPIVWQIITPVTDHLVGSSLSLAPGYRWRWKDLWMERQSDWTQDRLERQLGASEQPMIAQQTNQYVLYAFDQGSPMQVWMAPRYLLWVPVALLLLAASYFVVEFRWMQKPWIVLLLVLGCVAFSQWAWDLSVAFAQCLMAAMGIALVYLALKWVLDRRSRRRSVFVSRSNLSPVSVSSKQAGSGSSIANAKATVSPPALSMNDLIDNPNKRTVLVPETPSTATLGQPGESR